MDGAGALRRRRSFSFVGGKAGPAAWNGFAGTKTRSSSKIALLADFL